MQRRSYRDTHFVLRDYARTLFRYHNRVVETQAKHRANNLTQAAQRFLSISNHIVNPHSTEHFINQPFSTHISRSVGHTLMAATAWIVSTIDSQFVFIQKIHRQKHARTIAMEDKLYLPIKSNTWVIYEIDEHVPAIKSCTINMSYWNVVMDFRWHKQTQTVTNTYDSIVIFAVIRWQRMMSPPT